MLAVEVLILLVRQMMASKGQVAGSTLFYVGAVNCTKWRNCNEERMERAWGGNGIMNQCKSISIKSLNIPAALLQRVSSVAAMYNESQVAFVSQGRSRLL